MSESETIRSSGYHLCLTGDDGARTAGNLKRVQAGRLAEEARNFKEAAGKAPPVAFDRGATVVLSGG